MSHQSTRISPTAAEEMELGVVLCVGLGLQAFRNVLDHDGKKMNREYRVLIPSEVWVF